MNRIKVVNDVTDLVPVLRAVNSRAKLELFERLSKDWVTEREVEAEFGKGALKLLSYFDKMKLVDTRWVSGPPSKEPEKSYHTYYSTVAVNITATISEFSETLSIATMADKEYASEEKRVIEHVSGEGSKFFSEVADAVGISPTRLKGIVKRSDKLDYHGHRIELRKKSEESQTE
jgi:predicted DNA-binding ArsR family transcriptional regulator